MSACEDCWAEASRRAQMLGGSTPDRYREVIAEAALLPTWEPPWHRSSVTAEPAGGTDEH